jgi:hypothetical protein
MFLSFLVFVSLSISFAHSLSSRIVYLGDDNITEFFAANQEKKVFLGIFQNDCRYCKDTLPYWRLE